MNLQNITLFLLFQFTTPITAITSARVWTHFYPSCPGEPGTSMDLYESLAQTSNEFDVQSGTCQSISIDSLPDSRIQNVDHVSVDAEIFWSEPFDKCNITVHEVPGCVDPPVIEKEIRHRVGVSECAQRRFSPFDKVWVKLDCEEVGGPHPVAHYFHPVASNATVAHRPLNGTAMHSPHNLISHSRTMQKVSRRRLAKLPVA